MRISSRNGRMLGIVGSLAFLSGLGTASRAQGLRINPTKDVGLDQKLDAQVPLDTVFRDEVNQRAPLGTYFGKKPAVLVLPFYRCPGICTTELDMMVRTFQAMNFTVGKEFNVVIISINPKETAELAAAKKAEYLKLYGRPETASGWHFLTGEEPSIKRVAGAVGFRYVFDPKTEQYAHPSGIMILTPQGKVSRYFYGVDYPPKDVRLSLVEASRSRIGSPVDKILLYCYHYDPTTGRYGLAIMRVLQLSGTATLLILGTFLLVMFRRDRRNGPGIGRDVHP